MDACLVEGEVEVWIVSKIPRVVKYMHRKGQTAPSTYVKSGGEWGVGSGEWGASFRFGTVVYGNSGKYGSRFYGINVWQFGPKQ